MRIDGRNEGQKDRLEAANSRILQFFKRARKPKLCKQMVIGVVQAVILTTRM
jgi:hypothetical protein